MKVVKSVLSFIWGFLLGLSTMSLFLSTADGTWKVIPAVFIIISFVIILVSGSMYLVEHWDDA